MLSDGLETLGRDDQLQAAPDLLNRPYVEYDAVRRVLEDLALALLSAVAGRIRNPCGQAAGQGPRQLTTPSSHRVRKRLPNSRWRPFRPVCES